MRAELGSWIVRGAGLATGLAIVYGVVQLGVAAAGVLVLLFLAVLLASALEPIVGALRARLPVGRGWSVLIVYAAFVLLVAGFALLVVPAAAAQADALLRSLPASFAETRAWAGELRPAVLASSAETLIQSAQRIVGPAAQPDADLIIEVGATAAEVAIHVATLLGLVFFWIVEHARLQRYALAFLPAERRTGARDVWNEIEDRLGGWVRGQLILMGVIGVTTGIAYSLLGLPGALLLGLIAGIAEAIPMIGPLIGAIPAVLVAATVSPELAVVVAIVYVVLQAVEGYVLVPIVMRNTVGLSPFLVLASLLFGGAVAGIAGAFLAVPIVAAIEIVAARFQAREVPVLQDVSAVTAPDEPAADASQAIRPVRERVGDSGGVVR